MKTLKISDLSVGDWVALDGADLTFSAHCYSVHQLQHALRLAGVDKEIVMPNE